MNTDKIEGNINTPILGCPTCQTSAGRLGCFYHIDKIDRKFDENVIEDEVGRLGIKAHGILDTKPTSKECLKSFLHRALTQATSEAYDEGYKDATAIVLEPNEAFKAGELCMGEKLKEFVRHCNPDEGQPELRSCYNEWTGELLRDLDQLLSPPISKPDKESK
jgi:hypothetical protein